MASSVQLVNVDKRYAAMPAVRNVSLDIEAGEFMALVGPSGCGKSTLLRIIAGLVRQDGGEVRIDGRSVDHLAPKARNISMVFQSYALYPHMSVRENIATPLRLRRLSRAQRVPLAGRLSARTRAIQAGIAEDVSRIAAQVEIEALLGRRPAQLSGGQRQRVALARAMVRQPSVFLMDEPLSNLDARLRGHMRSELADLHARLGVTFIYVTHDQVEAMTMATRVALMNSGEILQVGRPQELYADPRTLEVARFLGTPEINVLPGRFLAGELLIGGQPTGWRPVVPAASAVSVAIRPEALSIGVGDSADIRLRTRAAKLESHGHDVIAHLDHGSDRLRVRVPAAHFDSLRASVAPGVEVIVSAARSTVWLFNEQGDRLPTGTQ